MLQTLINGLLLGAIYSLVSAGLTMNAGVMRIVNFAHADFLMVGMYFTYALMPALGFGGYPYWIFPVVGILMFLFGTLVFRTLIHPVIGTDESNGVILTMGLSYLLQNGFQLIFSSEYRSFDVPRSLSLGTVQVGDLYISVPRMIAFLAAVVLVAFIFWFLNKTDIGRAMRATSESTNVAKTLGINTKMVFTVAFGIGVTLAGLSGLLICPIYYVYPKVGQLFSTMAMSAMVMGGLGNIVGALISGLIIGLIEAFIGTYISLDMALIVNSLLLIVILLIKPNGLFGGGARRKA